MRLLLDTHAAAWWWFADARLPTAAREEVGSSANQVYVSPVTVWEMANKYRVGKWPEVAPLIAAFDNLMADSGFATLPISVAHGRLAGGLDGPHRDPFDRMLAAQSLVESLTIISADAAFRDFGVPVLWS